MNEIKPGDLVERIDDIGLDPRPVASVDGDTLTLRIGSLETEPIPAHLYRVVRKAGDYSSPDDDLLVALFCEWDGQDPADVTISHLDPATVKKWQGVLDRARDLLDETGQPINVVFDGPPSHQSGRFVEVEDDDGRGLSVGTWIERPDGFWVLRLKAVV